MAAAPGPSWTPQTMWPPRPPEVCQLPPRLKAVLCRINWGCWVHPGPTTDLGDESLTTTAMLLTGTLSLLPKLRACLLGEQARSRSKHIWTNDSYPGRKFMPATTCYYQHQSSCATSHLGPTMSCLHIMVSLLVTSVNLLLRLVGCSRVSCEKLNAKPTCALPKGQAPWHCHQPDTEVPCDRSPQARFKGQRALLTPADLVRHWAEFVWSLYCSQQTSWTGYSSHFKLQCNCITSLTQCIQEKHIIYSMILYHINMIKYLYMTTHDNKVVLLKAQWNSGIMWQHLASTNNFWFDRKNSTAKVKQPQPRWRRMTHCTRRSTSCDEKTRLSARYLLSTCNHGILVFDVGKVRRSELRCRDRSDFWEWVHDGAYTVYCK